MAIDYARDDIPEVIAADLALFAQAADLSDLPSPELLARSYRVPKVTVFAGMSKCAAAIAFDGQVRPGSGPAMTVLAAAGMCRRLADLSRDDAGKADAAEGTGVFLAASRRILGTGMPTLEAEVTARARELLSQQPPAVRQAAFPWQRDTNEKLSLVEASFPSRLQPAPPGRRAGRPLSAPRHASATVRSAAPGRSA